MTPDAPGWPVADRLVPVLVVDDAARTAGLVAALLDGGVRCAEITLRTPAALAAIEIAARTPDLRVGAGTVLTAQDVDRVVDAGAQFVVSPGLDDDVVARCRHHGVAVVPGVATATEVQRALRAGLDHLKLFPAEASGGVAAIDQLAGPFPDVRFLPSGGLTRDNVARYAASEAVFAVSGSWMASRAMIAAGDVAAIARLCRDAVDAVALVRR